MSTRKRHGTPERFSAPDSMIKAFKGPSIDWPDVVDLTDPVSSSVPADEPLFVPRPATVSFLDYEPHQVLSATLYMRNQDKSARRIKVVPPASSLFSVRAKNTSDKVAPGMEAQFTVTFRPPESGDHACDITFYTDRERFKIPVRAHGARPTLHLPDMIDFGESCPCNSTSTKSVLVRNIGRCAGKFQLSATPPFGVMPSEVLLDVGETVQCLVRLTPGRTGSVHGALLAAASCGVEHTVKLLGAAVNVDVTVSPTEVSFVNTFVTKTTQRAFHIVNDTSHAVKFSLHGAACQDWSEASPGTCEPAMPLCTTIGTVPENPDFGTAEISAFPLTGLVLPHSYIEVMVKFSPMVARTFVEKCHVAVEGQEKRQPVTFTGVGLGPLAVFSYDLLDVGNIYVLTLYRYSVLLENRGDIPVPFSIVAGNTPFASMFKFHPSSGTVPVDETLSIQVEVMANQLGRFDERVPVLITGTDSQLMIQFKGRVVGPTCQISTTTLDYGVVAYGFRYVKELILENTSEVPMPFSWRIENGIRPQGEFNLIPAHGAILPGAKQEYLVEFISQNICRYNAALVLDMPGIQNDVLKVNIVAECVVPKLHISSGTLDFGECPLDYPCTMAFVVSNKAKLPVKYVIDEQDPAGYALAEFAAHPWKSSVAPEGEQIVEFSLRTKRLGNMLLPCRIQAVGSSLPPLDFVIAAKSVGPVITCQLKASAMDIPAAVAFGRIPVMQSHSKTLCLKNTSLIPAEVKIFITSKTSVFAVDKRELVLSPGACMDLAVSVRLDETFSFSDLLQVLVTNGNALEVPLSAVGIGSTLSCRDVSDDKIDFGPQIAGRAFSSSILVENHGRRACSIFWQNDTLETLKKQTGRNLRGANGEQDLSLIPSQDRVCFSFDPKAASIPAKQARRFSLHGLSTITGNRSEIVQLLSVADVDTPQIHFSSRTLSFEYLYHPLLKYPPKAKTLDLRNDGKLPLRAAIRAHAPFSVIPAAVHLEPGDTVQTIVSMNHAYRKDLVSHKPRKRLEVSFPDNPHVEYVELFGNINYPNVHLSSTTVTFASTLNDTTTSQILTVTNTCEVPVKYYWELANGRSADIDVADAAMVGVPANEVFDIKPVEGLLQPGASEAVRVTFCAKANLKVEPRMIKCGLCQYTQTIQKDVTISNPSMVPFEWKYNGNSLTRQSVLTCTPLHGTIQPGEKQVATLKIKAGVPCTLHEVIYFEVAHFEPIAVWIDMEGVYTSIALSLPRHGGRSWLEQAVQACARLQDSGSILLQRIVQKDSKYLKQIQGKSLLIAVCSQLDDEKLDGVDLFGRVCMAAEGLTQIEVDCEADRQSICDALLAREHMQLVADSCTSNIPHNMKPLPSSPAMKRYSKVLCKYSTLPAVTASTYVLDFGVVVKGTHVSKNFRMQNTSTSHAAVSTDKGLLEAFGCTLRPEKLPRLPGLPDRCCTEITLNLDTQASQIIPGIVDFYLPLLVQNGPPVLVNVKACVAVPELTCDSTELDFGTVGSGMGRVLTVRLSNPGAVHAEWSVKTPAAIGDLRDWNSFRCDPASGVVAAHSHMDVKIIFVPQQPGQRLTEYKQDLAFKVAHSRTIMLHAIGCSFLNKVKIWPKELDLGVVHPGQTAEGELQLSNPGLSPIEVFSLNFDSQWEEEEKILSAWTGYRGDFGFALLKPRGIRTALWDDIRQDVRLTSNISKGTVANDVVQGSETSAGEPELNLSSSADDVRAPVANVSTLPHDESNRCSSDQDRITEAQSAPFIAIVSCFEANIATHQAQLLADRYSVPVTSMDHLILEAGELDQVHNESGRIFGDMIYDDLIGWEAGGALTSEHPRPYESVSAERRDQLAALALQAALQQAKYDKGLVIIGTACEFSPLALDLLMQAMVAVRGHNSCRIIDLHVDQQSAHRRYLDTLSGEERSAAIDRIEAYKANIANSVPPAAASRSKKVLSKKVDPLDGPKFPPGIDPMFGERYAKHDARVSPYTAADGQQHGNHAVGDIRVIKVDVDDPQPSKIHDQILGLQFDMSTMSIALPEVQVTSSARSSEIKNKYPGVRNDVVLVQADKTLLPPAYDVQVIRRPSAHAPRSGQQLLSLHPIKGEEEEGDAASHTRWVIQPGCAVRVRVKFMSEEVIDLSTRLAMMTQVGGAMTEVTVHAACAYPEVNMDPLRIFPRFKRKAKPGAELHQCYVMQPGHFDFGNVPVVSEHPGDTADAPSSHMANLMLENSGKFVAQVRLDLMSLASETRNTPPPSKPGKAKKSAQQQLSAFSVTPRELSLDVGETGSFKLACFPFELGPIQDTLKISVNGNPNSSEFLIIATGQIAAT